MGADVVVMVGTWGTGFFFQRIFNQLAFISGVFLAVLHYRLDTEGGLGSRLALGLTVSVLMALLVISNTVCLFFDDTRRYGFASPDGRHAIVVEEEGFLQAGWIRVYERINPLVVRLRETEATHDSYGTLFAGDYTVTWREDGVTLVFEGGTGVISLTFD